MEEQEYGLAVFADVRIRSLWIKRNLEIRLKSSDAVAAMKMFVSRFWTKG
jgi:hypothetical protein